MKAKIFLLLSDRQAQGHLTLDSRLCGNNRRCDFGPPPAPLSYPGSKEQRE